MEPPGTSGCTPSKRGEDANQGSPWARNARGTKSRPTEWSVLLPKDCWLAAPATRRLFSLLFREEVPLPDLGLSLYLAFQDRVDQLCAVARADCTVCDPDNAACMAVQTASEISGTSRPAPRCGDAHRWFGWRTRSTEAPACCTKVFATASLGGRYPYSFDNDNSCEGSACPPGPVEGHLLCCAATAVPDHPVLTAQRHDHVLPGRPDRDRYDPELLSVIHARLAFRSEKFQGPLTIMAALPASNWLEAPGDWLQLRQALDAEPSVTSSFHRLRA